MKRNLLSLSLLWLLTFTITLSLPASEIEQEFRAKGERYFRFVSASKHALSQLAQIISIDQVRGDTIVANANLEEFRQFLAFNIAYELLPHPSDLIDFDAIGLDQITETRNWDFYPTYDAYVTMMNNFGSNHPNLCDIQNIGTLPSGRQLLVAKITSNQTGPKPKFLYTATMHGDELAGYVLSLKLIDHLLENYGTDPFVTRLVDSVEIWINPLANPDGTYYAGNHTINGARRRNANNVDLNRNFPDPQAGPNPDGNPWQPETIHFMNHSEAHKFNISSNWHGGAEVCNYPWDTWAHLTADNAWWYYTMREYADTVHAYSPSPYMRGFNNGITNGYAWYTITGGRQDYMNYFQQCREFCLELTNQKIPPPAQLPTFWNYNYRSFLNYIEQSLYGIRGVVSDAATGDPALAMISIQGHDFDSSYVFSNPQTGSYHRPIFAGTYDLTFSAPCYKPLTIQGVNAANRQTTWLNVQLEPALADFTASETTVSPGSVVNFSSENCGPVTSWQWIFPGGVPGSSNDPNPVVLYPQGGKFDVTLIASANGMSDTITKTEYITAITSYLMGNSTVNTCFALFYDSGGPNGNYNNSENFTMTFLPDTPGAMVEADFLAFNTEANYDFLYIYDGTNTSAPQFPGSPYHGLNSPGNLVATNDSGAITFRFTSDYSVTRPGWEAEINCSGLELLPGDANCDGAVDITDVITTINFIMGQNPQPFCFENADVNADGSIDITDVIGAVNIIMSE